MVLRRRPYHRRAADVDLLHAAVEVRARGAERPGQLVEAGLVVHADQRAADRPTVAHGTVTLRPLMVQPSRTSRPTQSTSWRRSASLMRSVSESSVSSSSIGTATCATI